LETYTYIGLDIPRKSIVATALDSNWKSQGFQLVASIVMALLIVALDFPPTLPRRSAILRSPTS
jgi:hypothetical protein